jgi:hypothetical protein
MICLTFAPVVSSDEGSVSGSGLIAGSGLSSKREDAVDERGVCER